MPYQVVAADTGTGQNLVLCCTLTQAEAEEIVEYLAQHGPNLRFAIVADDDDE